jgi:hypothetical protein
MKITLLLSVFLVAGCASRVTPARLVKKKPEPVLPVATPAPIEQNESVIHSPEVVINTQSCPTMGAKNSPGKVKTLTGTGLTYEEAKFDLYSKLPSIGVLQNLKVNTAKASTLNAYAEANVVTKDINVNFDSFMTFNCKLDGLFAITAVIPTESISYLPTSISELTVTWKKEYATFAFAKKQCDDNQYTIIIDSSSRGVRINNAIERILKRGTIQVSIVCGPFKMITTWSAGRIQHVNEVFGNKYNLIVVGTGGGLDMRDLNDYSKELNLEMLKNAMN